MTLDYLSEIERQKIEVFNNDTVLVNAIRKVLLETIYNNGVLRKDCPPDPLRNGALGLAFLTLSAKGIATNEQLGEDLRALAQGVNLLEKGLLELSKIKKEDPSGKVSPEVNEAI